MKLSSTDSPAVLLDRLLSGDAPTRLILITGGSGSGKSTLCQGIVHEARGRGLGVEGVLSPAVFDGPHKVGIDLEDVATGTRKRLASLRPQMMEDAPTRKWAFDEAVLNWGDELLGHISHCDVLVIDELGPLELRHHQGLLAGLAVIERRMFRLGFVVIRPSLLADARRLWQVDAVIDCTPER